MLERTLWKISKNHHIFGKQIMKSLRFLEDLGRFLDLFFWTLQLTPGFQETSNLNLQTVCHCKHLKRKVGDYP